MIWRGLLNCNTRPLTPAEANMFVRFNVSNVGVNAPFPAEMEEGLEQVFLYQVLKKRIDHIEVATENKPDIAPIVILWCSYLSDRPGIAVMWAYTLYLIWLKYQKRITLLEWVFEFPNGVPLELEYGYLWDSQKADMKDNFVDHMSQWPKSWSEVQGGK